MRTSVILPMLMLFALFASGVKSDPNETEILMKKLAKFGSFSQQQLSNARAILNACNPFTKDLRQLAYVLSTAIGESNITPIKEYRANSGYLHDVQNRYWYSGYFGRGYVQLTWDYNYKKFGQLLGIDLLGKPDLALDPSVAGKIICIGMTKGLFTGVGLNDYFTSSKADWTNARRIVNGMDKASEFGDRASRLYGTPM